MSSNESSSAESDDGDDAEMNVRMVPLFNREESMFFLDLVGGEFKINNCSIFIEDSVNQHQHDTGNRTWDGSIVLCKALEKNYSMDDKSGSSLFSFGLKNLNVLELGSGTGLVSIAASYLGAANSYGTDLKYCLPLLKHNIHLNRNNLVNKQIDAMELDWFWFDERDDNNTLIIQQAVNNTKTNNNNNNNENQEKRLLRDKILDISIDVIVAADVVWQEPLLIPFLSTVSILLRNKTNVETDGSATTPQKKCILLYTDRYENLKSKLIENLEEFHLKYYFHDYDKAFHEAFRDESMSIVTIYA